MKRRWLAIAAAAGVVALPSLAGAASQLTATGVRIGDHAVFVRVVVDFNGTLPQRQVEFDELNGTMFHIAHPGLKSQVAVRSGYGVRVALQSGGQQLHIAATFARHRFKYVSYAVVTHKRLAIDLWKSAPPPPGGNEYGYRDCLRIMRWHVSGGSVSASGTGQGVFENTFQVVVRGASGSVLGRRTVHGPSWTTNVKYTASRRQAGTLEAVDFSPKDGALACLYEARITLPAS